MAATPITQAQLNDLKTTLRARFNAGLAEGSQDWRKIAGYITSAGQSNTYAWLSQFPAFRQWVGARQHKAMKERAYVVQNKLFENTIDIPRTDIEDDNFGHYADIAQSHGVSVKDLENDLVFSAISNGVSSTCYDGQFFFDTDHPVYPNEDGTGTAATVSNFQTGDAPLWVLLCTKRAPKPFYLQERTKATFESQTTAASSGVFERDVYSYGGRWRGNAAYGFWQCAFGSKQALTSANLNAAYDAMMAFTGDGQRKLGILPDTLVVGGSNRAAAETILKAQTLANGATNIDFGRVELVVTPWMA